MVMAPQDACVTCGGTYWVAVLPDEFMEDEKLPMDLEEKPCPTCNPLGIHPKVRY